MKNNLYLLAFVAAALILVGSKCSPSPVTPTKTLPRAEESVTGQGEGDDLVGVKFVAYTNKAQGYSILRPDNWYWRHYIANEIKDMNPMVVDYFITDSNPLPGLGSEYLGKIVIEVSQLDLSQYAKPVSGLVRSDSFVGQVVAKRFAGERVNQSGEKQKVVEYQFSYKEKSYRLILNSGASMDDQAIFEQVVSSFKF